MSNSFVQIQSPEAGVKVLTISRPEALNALSTEVLEALEAAIDQLADDAELRALIITGEGRAFVAGADISQMRGLSPEQGVALGQLGCRVFRKIELLPVPVIAAVNGFALGGGCELALACDVRLASEKARFGQPEVSLGITPGFGGTQRLARIVGKGLAAEMILFARNLKADEALRIGLVNRVVPPDSLMPEALALAKSSQGLAPLAVKYAKEAINRGLQTDIETATALENQYFGLCFATHDQKEGMGAFIEKRTPQFNAK